jgi:hypothetical protein
MRWSPEKIALSPQPLTAPPSRPWTMNFLHEQEEEEDGKRDDAGGGRDQIPPEREFLLKASKPDRQREGLMALQEGRPGQTKLVPGADDRPHVQLAEGRSQSDPEDFRRHRAEA